MFAFYFFSSMFIVFLYYEIVNPTYGYANLCKRLTESEHKSASNIPFRLTNDISECP